MYPFINIGSVPLPTYGTLIIFGFVIGVILVTLRAKLYDIPKLNIIMSSIFIAIGLLFGSKLLYALIQLPSLIDNWDLAVRYPIETLTFALSGYVFYGGLIGALIGLKLFCFQFNQPFSKLTNLYTPIIPLIHSIGRLGCFFSGCCYGFEYYGILHIDYPDNAYIEGLSLVPRFPVQLFESLLNLILFFVLFIYTKKPRKEGSILGIYLVSYALIRFVTEFFRGDLNRGLFLGISTSQWISLLLIPIGIYIIKKRDHSK